MIDQLKIVKFKERNHRYIGYDIGEESSMHGLRCDGLHDLNINKRNFPITSFSYFVVQSTEDQFSCK